MLIKETVGDRDQNMSINFSQEGIDALTLLYVNSWLLSEPLFLTQGMLLLCV
jgi:hypothetical protein